MRARIEPFGAWVRLDAPAALVAIDRDRARSLGIDGGSIWRDGVRPSAPLEVHLAVTARCGAGCTGCYLDATADGDVPPFDVLARRLDAIAEAGVFTVAFGGGEPLSRDDLGRLASHARSRGLSAVVTTSGIGMTAARADELRAFDMVNVSYDGVGSAYAEVRGFDGAKVAERAMTLLRESGVRFGVNVVLTRKTFDRVEETVARAASLGAEEAQLLRYKPSGRAASLAYLATRLGSAQARAVPALLERIVRRGEVRVRIDCSMLPFLSGLVKDAGELARWGIFGCEAAHHLAAGRVDGTLAPCSFAESTGVRIEEVGRAFLDDDRAARFRDHVDRAPEPCASCALRDVCRGGCRVVAAHAGDPWGPDPECPRVVAHREKDAREART